MSDWSGPTRDGEPAEPLKAIPVCHPGRWVAVAIIAVLAAMAVHTLAFSYVVRGNNHHDLRWQWDVVGTYLFDHRILLGLQRTLLLTVVCMVIGVVLVTILA